MMSPGGFKFMMDIICELLNKKDSEINADFYKKQLGEIDIFIDEDVLKAVDILAKEETRLPQNIIAYIHKHAMIFSSKRRLQEAPQEPKNFVQDYDEEKKEIRKKNIEKIHGLGTKFLCGEISYTIMYREFEKMNKDWFKATVKYPGSDVIVDVRTQKEYSFQGESEMWKELEEKENKPVDRSKNLIGNVVQSLPGI